MDTVTAVGEPGARPGIMIAEVMLGVWYVNIRRVLCLCVSCRVDVEDGVQISRENKRVHANSE